MDVIEKEEAHGRSFVHCGIDGLRVYLAPELPWQSEEWGLLLGVDSLTISGQPGWIIHADLLECRRYLVHLFRCYVGGALI